MPATIVIGTQWGDEGKGKLVDMLSENMDYVVRFQGGNNAGHTVKVKDETFKLHLIPSGVLQGKRVVLGNGMVIEPKALLEEIKQLEERGITVDLIISDRAHLVLPYHKMIDQAIEGAMGKSKIGTTHKGIGPAYADKIYRRGIRVIALKYPDYLKKKVSNLVDHKQKVLEYYGSDVRINKDEISSDYLEYAKQLNRYIKDTSLELNSALDAGKNILLEGAQGSHLDIDHGTYPYVTSSNTVAGAACTGAGIGPTRIKKVIGITKAYTTRVGAGDLPTELKDAEGERLREQGHEYGTTTGRPRRCGWFDAVVVRYSCMINGIDELVITKLDVLDGFETVKICTGYAYEGKTLINMPTSRKMIKYSTPIYEEHPGWDGSVGITNWADLPENARKYVKRIESLCSTPVKYISTGPKRSETIIL